MKGRRYLLIALLLAMVMAALSVASFAEERDGFLYEAVWTDQKGRSLSDASDLRPGEVIHVEITVRRVGWKEPRYGIYGMELTFSTKGLRYLEDGTVDRSVPGKLQTERYPDETTVSMVYYDLSKIGVVIENPLKVCAWSYRVETPEQAEWVLSTALTYPTEMGESPAEPWIEIALDLQGGRLMGKAFDQSYPAGTVIRLPEAARAGYLFRGWSDGNRIYQPYEEITLTENLFLHALWTAGEGGGGSGGFIVPSTPQKPTSTEQTDTPAKGEPIQFNGLNDREHIAYMVGYPDGRFGPNDPLTREAAVTVLYRLLTTQRRDEIFTADCSFSDVPEGAWFRKAVASMAKGGYVLGYTDGRFGVGRAISRAEFVTMLVRFTEESGRECPFADVSEEHWAYRTIATAAHAGWIVGDGTGCFRPEDSITRAEAVTMLNRVLRRGGIRELPEGIAKHFSDNTDPSIWYYDEILEATTSHRHQGERGAELWLDKLTDDYDMDKYERP